MRGRTWLLIGVILMGILAPLFAPYDPLDFSFTPFEAPSLAHPFGVNDGGMDILSEWLYAYQNAILFGWITALASMTLALLAGVVSGWCGGVVDWLFLRLADWLLAIPTLLLLILLAAFFQPSLYLLALILALLSFPLSARLIRAQTRILRHRLHLVASAQMGGKPLYIFYRHLLPELLPMVLFLALGRFKSAIMAQTALAFLGLISPAEKSLGMMIRYASSYYYLEGFWWWVLPPLVLLWLMLLLFSLYLFGLEKELDPRFKGAFFG